MSPRTFVAICVSALAGLMLGAPSPAAAGTMGSSGHYYGDPGANAVTASYDGTNVTFTDSAGFTPAFPGASGCVVISPTSATCNSGYTYLLELFAGSDTFTYVGGTPPGLGPGNYLFTVEGGAGADVLNGSPYADTLSGHGRDEDGNNVVDPTGNDQVFGNGGDDRLSDSDGASNRVEGGAGDDRVDNRGTGTDSVLGGPGNDRLLAGAGPDTIDGEDGEDVISGGDGNDMVQGGTGNDDVEGGGDQDVTDGGAGDDLVSASFHGGGCSTDTLIGGSGRDSLYAACGVPTLKMRDGAKDEARCLPKITTAVVERDKVDEVEGGACESKARCGKKAKKGAAAAGGSKKAKKCKRKGRRK